MNNLNRGTGRTTRMLRQAFNFYQETQHAPLIIVHQGSMVNVCRNLARKEQLEGFRSNWIRPLGTLYASSFRGLKRDQIFIDHYVYDVMSRQYPKYDWINKELNFLSRTS